VIWTPRRFRKIPLEPDSSTEINGLEIWPTVVGSVLVRDPEEYGLKNRTLPGAATKLPVTRPPGEYWKELESVTKVT
jgi:hypothetical protein